MSGRIESEHGAVCDLRHDRFGYFGWPTVTRMSDATLIVTASGLRNAHVCPYGRTILCRSVDSGSNWSAPRVIHDSPCDDRDSGVVALDGSRLLVTWFTSDNRETAYRDAWRDGFRNMAEADTSTHVGAWQQLSEDSGTTWSAPQRLRVNAPHGPIRLASGRLLYLGKVFPPFCGGHVRGGGAIEAIASDNDGRSWFPLGTVPLYPGTTETCYHEAHVAELPDGRLLGHIRLERGELEALEPLGLQQFSIMQTQSTDGGVSWSPATPLGWHGSPPHLSVHSSGVLICTYGYRLEPYGQRVAFSRDAGRTWDHDWVLRDDGPDSDLGYPSTVELGDGQLLTVYYQKPATADDQCALLWSRWALPEAVA
jgi:hypothetical protein